MDVNRHGNTQPRLDDGFGQRDLVGMYLAEISRHRLLNAAEEVYLAKRVEAGLYPSWLLEHDNLPAGAARGELEQIAAEGVAAKARFIQANLRLVVSVVRRYPRPAPMCVRTKFCLVAGQRGTPREPSAAALLQLGTLQPRDA